MPQVQTKAEVLAMLECHNLPFVKVNLKADVDDRVNWFAVQSTGHYGLDCDVGTQCAYALIKHLRQGSESMGAHSLLSNVALAMLKRDDLQNEAKGLLVGFMSTIGLCFVHREP
jgi:hypothetical protein